MLVDLDRPIHPYRLATLINRRLGPGAEIDRESIYKLVRALAKRGLVACEEREASSGSWRRQWVYSATDATRRALSQWMATRTTLGDTFCTEFQLKVAFSRPCDAPVLLLELDGYETDCTQKLAKCEGATADAAISSSWASLGMGVSREASELHLQAELAWIMSVRDRINEYLTEHHAKER
ncbi:MAG: PadR family transcriptional regulator [Solirubrobacteraceae bacterium]